MFRTACIFVALALCAATAPPRISLDLAGDTHDAMDLHRNSSDVDYTKSIDITDSAAGAALPVAKAFDHVDQTVLVTTIITLVDLNGELNNTEILNETSAHDEAQITSTAHLNMGIAGPNPADTTCIRASEQRSTYVFTYDAKDAAGNHAEQLTFVLEINDIVKPDVGEKCNSATLEAGNEETILSQACPTGEETCTASSLVDSSSATRGDTCAKTLHPVVDFGAFLTAYDTTTHSAGLTCQQCVDLHKTNVTFTCTDTAGIYSSTGTSGSGNTDFRNIQISCEDTTPPTVVSCDSPTGDCDSIETFECNGGNGLPTSDTTIKDVCGKHIAATPTFEELYVNWDADTKACDGVNNARTNALLERSAEAALDWAPVGPVVNCWTGSDAVAGCDKATNTATVTRTYTVVDTTPPFFTFTNYAAGAQLDVFVTSHSIIDAAQTPNGQTQTEKSWSVITNYVDQQLIRTDSDCCDTTPELVGSKWYSCTCETDDCCSDTESTETTDDHIPLGNTGTLTEYWKREYTIKDDADNTYTSSHVVLLQDLELPIITVQECGSDSYTDGRACTTDVASSLTGVYTDAGAKCSDFVDGSLSHAVEVSGDVVNLNTQTSKTFTIKYNCEDLSSNEAAEAIRTVRIADTTPPVIDEVANYTYEAGYTYNDILPIVNDDMCVDTNLTCIIADSTTVATSPAVLTSDGDVNTMVPGTYTITYSASDQSGNEAEPVTRVVTIADTMAPVIVLSHPDTADADVYPVGNEKAFHHVEGSTAGTANSSTTWGTQKDATDSTGRTAKSHHKIPKIVGQDSYSVASDSTWMPKESFMAESTSVNGWFIGAIACAVTGVALLGLATRKVSTEVPV